MSEPVSRVPNDQEDAARRVAVGTSSVESDRILVMDYLQEIWRRKWIMLAVMLACLALGGLITYRQAPLYTATMVLAPVQDARDRESGFQRVLGQLPGLSPAQTRVTPFDRFLYLLTSVRLARRLTQETNLLKDIFAEQWDESANQWRAPDSLQAKVKRAVYGAFGLSDWAEPSPTSLSSFLQRAITLTEVRGLQRVEMQTTSPDLGVEVLTNLHRLADELVREEVEQRTAQQIAYVEEKLGDITIAEYRDVLRDLLSSQEKTMMLLQSDMSYAASIVEPPVVSELPTTPNPIKNLLISVILGLLLGIFIVLIISVRRP